MLVTAAAASVPAPGGIVIGVAVGPPRCQTEVVGPEQVGEHVDEAGGLGGHRPVGKAQSDCRSRFAPQSLQCDRGLLGPRRGDVDAERFCVRMRSLAIGDGDDRNLDTEVVQPLHEPSRSEHLVVGMRRDDNEPAGQGDAQLPQGPEAPRPEPCALVGAGVHVVDD